MVLKMGDEFAALSALLVAAKSNDVSSAVDLSFSALSAFVAVNFNRTGQLTKGAALSCFISCRAIRSALFITLRINILSFFVSFFWPV